MNTHPHGLAADLQRLQQQRRRALGWLAAAGTWPLVGCGGGGDSNPPTPFSSGTAANGTTCTVIPNETAGPFPGDGTNGANALALAGIARRDIRKSVGSASATAAGVQLTLNLKLVNTNSSCASLAGYAVYIWHCDALGRYSMYSSGVSAENYLRGVQVSEADGSLSFVTIFPGCYSGRWPHIHFEVFRNLAAATTGNNDVKTSQIALPDATCREVYTSSGYTNSLSRLNGVRLASDSEFSDGSTLQLATCTGNVAAGYVAALNVGIAA